MRLPRVLAFLVLFAAAVHAHGHDERTPSRYLDLINTAGDSVTALAIAPAGGSAYQDIMLGEPLRGGRTSITVGVPAGGCLRDLRVGFRDGRKLRYPDLDLCRFHRLELRAIDGR